MDTDTAFTSAKSNKSSPAQLMELIGISVEIDRLLAKNPIAATEMLRELSKSADPVVVRNVASNAATSKDVLARLGPKNPSSLLKNPSFASILASDPKFSSVFDKPTLHKLLCHKACPEVLGDWALKNGTADQQAAYLFRAPRSDMMKRKFLKSKHYQVVGALLEKVDSAYFDWAVAAGWPCDASAKSIAGELPNAGRAQIDAWLTQKADETSDMWSKLVPKSGCAETIQGELVRSIGRIQSEYYRNAMMNWGDGFFEKMTTFIEVTLKSDGSFSPLTKRYVEALVVLIRKSGSTGAAISKGRKTRSAAFGGNIMLVSDVEIAHKRLKSLIVLWCEKHPDPIPNPEYRKEVEYSRTPDQYVTFIASCPSCGGVVSETERRYQCTGASGVGEGCGFGFAWKFGGRAFDSSEVERLLENKVIGPLKGFFTKASNFSFDADIVLKFDPDTSNYKLEFDFDGSARSALMLYTESTSLVLQDSLGVCPKCGARVFESVESYVCESAILIAHGVDSACDFKLGKTHLGQKIDREQISKLLSTGSTDLLNGFVSKRVNRSFEAKLYWNPKRGHFDFWFEGEKELKPAKLRKR